MKCANCGKVLWAGKSAAIVQLLRHEVGLAISVVLSRSLERQSD
jgi:hypothetical protein